MSLLCAPAKSIEPAADLTEIDYGTHKHLYDRSGTLRFTDVDWKGDPTSFSNVILSYHNFEHTPDLEPILAHLQEIYPEAAYYKIATMAHSSLDSFRMLNFVKAHPNVIGVCMGPCGTITRVLAPVYGTPLMYAPVNEKTIPGQLLLSELLQIYHFKSVTSATPLYGLIGYPVDQSLGHLFHNDRGEGLYVKIPLQPHELSLIRTLPFKGLSVTAPLKEAVVPYLDALDPVAQKIGAVNTIAYRGGKLIGYNTDGEAALDILGNVHGKKIVVIGAGGAARAIIYTAISRGGDVTVVHRTHDKAVFLAKAFGCRASRQIPKADIVINATGVPIDNSLDIKVPAPFGLQMYFQQALAQRRIWSG